jgi:hypothetical protein
MKSGYCTVQVFDGRPVVQFEFRHDTGWGDGVTLSEFLNLASCVTLLGLMQTTRRALAWYGTSHFALSYLTSS